ncbi:MAG: hypothetical protein AAAC48_07675 [Phyllobacterium sp.]|uniref:hypothetical protein n=1 Tax=Phyllobacterium sp. TaxID=1871046 RepID=UPI0030F23ACA
MSMTPQQQHGKKRRKMVALLMILTIIAFAPLLSLLASYGIAETLGCQVDEGSVHPCFIGSFDIGSTLYGMGVMGWLMIPAAPLMLIAILGWLAVGVVSMARYLCKG